MNDILNHEEIRAMVAMMRPARITDWALGDAVVVESEVRNIETPERLKRGTTGTLEHLERIQDGVEVWKVRAAGRCWAASHKALRKIDQTQQM